jgi:hypothetical protein
MGAAWPSHRWFMRDCADFTELQGRSDGGFACGRGFVAVLPTAVAFLLLCLRCWLFLFLLVY